MAPTRTDFEDAVAAFWDVRREQMVASKLAGAVGAGTAGSVRGAGHFNAVAALIGRFFLDAGYPPEAVRLLRNQRLELPGYYRPQKQWDVVVAHRNTLVAAFELKALCGPSFGNNYNNRIEEALGSAIDIRRAALADMFPGEPPWLAYFFLMEDAPGSRRPIATAKGSFPIENVWFERSYQERFEIFCTRLRDERLYDSVCYVTSSPADPKPQEPVAALDWKHFVAAINARLSYLNELGLP